MRAMHRFLIGLTSIATTVSPALAAGGGSERQVGLVAWIFMGFCALVIVAQLIPAALLFIGIIKGIFQKTEEKSSASIE